jgi:PPOX class probable F420-dependent enzyme
MVRLDDDAQRLLDGANYGFLSTLMADGSPKVESVWVGRERDLVLVTTDAKSIKAINAARDPRVALSVVAFDNPYDQLLIRGKVVEIRDDDELVAMDALSQKYLGASFPRRRWSKRVVLVIEPSMARYRKSPLRHQGANS